MYGVEFQQVDSSINYPAQVPEVKRLAHCFAYTPLLNHLENY